MNIMTNYTEWYGLGYDALPLSEKLTIFIGFAKM